MIFPRESATLPQITMLTQFTILSSRVKYVNRFVKQYFKEILNYL